MAAADRHAKTEKPTAKRRNEARQRGQVARSPDVTAFAMLLLGSFVVPSMISSTESRVLGVVGAAQQAMTDPTVAGALVVLGDGLRAAAYTVIPYGAVLAGGGLVASYLQVGRGFSLKAMTPKLSRINPKAGFGRLFSKQTVVSLAKQLAKLAALIGVAYDSIHGVLVAVPATTPVGLASTLGLGASAILHFVRTTALLGLVLGAADYIYQRHHLLTMLKMTKQEVKEENRQHEGDPAVKAEIKRRAYQISRRAMISRVRTADVVIANPTHFTVALRYDADSQRAPTVVAKGAGELALTLRALAAEYEIPVVEDPPLARYLFALCDIDQQIPGEIYLAVARLLAYTYALPASVRGVGVHTRQPSQVPVDPGELADDPATRRALRAALQAAGA